MAKQTQQETQSGSKKVEADGPAIFTITVPFSRFEGERGGVRFREGRGETSDPAVAEELAGLGYRVDPDPRTKTKKAEVSQ